MKHSTTRWKFLKTLCIVSAAPAILHRYDLSKKEAIPRIGSLSGLGVLPLETFFKCGHPDFQPKLLNIKNDHMKTTVLAFMFLFSMSLAQAADRLLLDTTSAIKN